MPAKDGVGVGDAGDLLQQFPARRLPIPASVLALDGPAGSLDGLLPKAPLGISIARSSRVQNRVHEALFSCDS